MKNTAYQPKTGQTCGCRPGIERDNCPQCEGTGQRIDFAAIRSRHTPTPIVAPVKSEYDWQAETFLVKFGIAFRATLSDSKPAPWAMDEKPFKTEPHHFRVTLSKANKNPHGTSRAFDVILAGKVIDTVFYDAKSRVHADEVLKSLRDHDGVECDHVRAVHAKLGQRITFDFWSSIADAEKGIETVSAYCVLSCISGDCNTPEKFEDFCADMGYETDSIKALQTFRRCLAFSKRLNAFFTPSEIEALQEIQ